MYTYILFIEFNKIIQNHIAVSATKLQLVYSLILRSCLSIPIDNNIT